MANKQPRKPTEQTAAIPTTEPTPPPVADAAPAIAEEVPVVAAAAVESVVAAVSDTVTDIRETAAPASLNEKGKTMVETIKNATDNMTAKGEQVFAELKNRAEGALGKSQQIAAELTDFNKGNLEALVESGKIAAKGFERLGQDQAEYARKSFEQTTAAFKGMAGVKSPTELAKLHSDYVRSSFDAMVAQTSHSTEAFLKLAGEIAQPISNRFAVAAEKVKLAA